MNGKYSVSVYITVFVIAAFCSVPVYFAFAYHWALGLFALWATVLALVATAESETRAENKPYEPWTKRLW
ncbi:MAG: hypothetical protein IH859_04245 [Chloroflexi bacterium]|nr:hypothetical protein [Chloroflexota bacterium]